MDNAVVIKDELADVQAIGMPVDGRFISFKSTLRNLERVMKAYDRDLRRRYPNAGERLAYAMKEAAMNQVMHGSPGTRIFLHDLRRGNVAYGWSASDGQGFDAKKAWERKRCWCDDPNYVQELGDAHHGLGMFLIANQVERFIYENFGNVVYLGVDLSKG